MSATNHSFTNTSQATAETRKAAIQLELQALGLRMEPSLSGLDGEGHALMRIADDECVDPVELGPEVLALAEEWSLIEGVHDQDLAPAPHRE